MEWGPGADKRAFIEVEPVRDFVPDPDPLVAFFLEVSENEALFESYKKDPAGEMRKRHIDEAAIRAITSGDFKALQMFLVTKPPKPGVLVIAVLPWPKPNKPM